MRKYIELQLQLEFLLQAHPISIRIFTRLTAYLK